MTFAVVANLPARSAAEGGLAAALDAVDQADVDDLGVEGAPAGIVDGNDTAEGIATSLGCVNSSGSGGVARSGP